jgi:predicted AAA+ superfamily ATPase
MQQLYFDVQQETRDRLNLLKTSLVGREHSFKEWPGKAQVAIGVRRCGKTWLMYEKMLMLLDSGINPDRILYLNLEDDRLQPKNLSSLQELINHFYQANPDNHNQKVYLFFDEIQEIPDWATIIRRLLDTRQCEIYLTGSSAKLLSKEIATSMRGRSLATEIWPFDFAEYVKAKKLPVSGLTASQKSQDMLLAALESHLLTGGFPEVVITRSPEFQAVLQEYVDVAILRDIVERYQIKNIQLIRYLVRTMLQNVSTLFSVNKFYNDLKSQGYQLGKSTLYDYLSYIEDCYLAFTVPIYSESLRKTQVNPRKIYACDTGLVTAYQYGYSKNLGRLFENFIYLQLRKQCSEIYYTKTRDGYEVDFLAVFPTGERKLYQVSWDISDKETLTRETRALESAKQELKLPGELVTPQSFINQFINHDKF